MNKLASVLARGFTIAIIILGCGFTSAQEIQVVMRHAPAQVKNPSVTVGDVAEIFGGSSVARANIARLDLDSISKLGGQVQISRKQVSMRILVDGYARDQVMVLGPDHITVQRSQKIELDQQVEQIVAREISRQFGIEESDVMVRVNDPTKLSRAAAKLGTRDFETRVTLASRIPLGRSYIEIEFVEPRAKLRFSDSFRMDIVIEKQVAVTTRSVKRGEVIQASMVQMVKRPFTNHQDLASSDQVIGQQAVRDLPQHQIVLSSHLNRAAEPQKPTIRVNELVDVIVPVQFGEIRLKNARAMTSGKMGESITVMNTTTRRQLAATVVGNRLAKVELPGSSHENR